MPEKRLGLDIQSDSVRAVVIKGGLKPSVAAYAVAERNGEEGLEPALDQVLESLRDQTDMERTPCSVSFGRGATSFKNIPIPFSEPKKIRQVLPFELEAKIPLKVEDVIADYHIIRKGEKTDCLAAVTSASVVETGLETMKAAGLKADILSPSGVSKVLGLLAWGQVQGDGIFLDVETSRTMIVLFSGKDVLLVRNLRQGYQDNLQALASQINLTLRAFSEKSEKPFDPTAIYCAGAGTAWDGLQEALEEQSGLSVNRVDLAREIRLPMEGRVSGNWDPLLLDGALALALYRPTETAGFNMRQGPFAVRRRWEAYKGKVIHAAILAGILLVVFGARFYANSYVLDKRIENLESQIEQVYQSVMDNRDSKGAPLKTLMAEMEAMSQAPAFPGSGGSNVLVVDVLKAISDGIPNTLQVKVTKFSVNPERVEVNGETDAYESATEIKTGLEGQPLLQNVNLQSVTAGKAENVWKFRIKAQVRKDSETEK